MMQAFEAKQQMQPVENKFDNQEMLYTQGVNFLMHGRGESVLYVCSSSQKMYGHTSGNQTQQK